MKFLYFFPSLLFVLIFSACYREKLKAPDFNTSIGVIKNNIRKIISCREIYFLGIKNSYDHKENSFLKVELIDPSINITFGESPLEDVRLKKIGAEIVSNIKMNLKDSSEYNQYTIIFTHKDHNWLNSSTSRFFYY